MIESLNLATGFPLVSYTTMALIAGVALWRSAESLDCVRSMRRYERDVRACNMNNRNSVRWLEGCQKEIDYLVIEHRSRLATVGDTATSFGMLFTLAGLALNGARDDLSIEALIGISIGTTLAGIAISIVTVWAARALESAGNDIGWTLLPDLPDDDDAPQEGTGERFAALHVQVGEEDWA